MMFSFAYPIEDVAEINGKKYELDLSFDNVLRLIDMLSDDELSDEIQVITGLRMLIGEVLDCDIEEMSLIFNAIFEKTIFTGSQKRQSVDIKGNPMPSVDDNEEELYSLKEDAEYIYASFMQDYGMDLFEHQGKLHWMKFRALLSGLRDDTKFKKVLEIRQMELPTGKGTEKQRKAILDAKKAYALKSQEVEYHDDDE